MSVSRSGPLAPYSVGGQPRIHLAPSYFGNWGRFAGVLAVMCVHSVTYLTVPPFIAADDWWNERIMAWKRWLLTFGMPFFIFGSGMATSYTADYDFRRFTIKKTTRLLIPAIIGLFVFVIPAFWLTRNHFSCGIPSLKQAGFFMYYYEYFANFGCHGFEWLWFLISLYFISMYNLFFCRWMLALYKQDEQDVARCSILLLGKILATTLLWLIFGLSPSFLLFMISPYIVILLAKTFLPYHPQLEPVLIAYPALASLGMAYVIKNVSDLGNKSFVSLCFFNLFYVSGYHYQRYSIHQEILASAAPPTETAWGFFYVLGMVFFFLVPGFTFPISSENAGSPLRWPMYHTTYDRVSYVLLGWTIIAFVTIYMRTTMNRTFNNKLYKFLTEGSMTAYVVHPFFILIYAAYFDATTKDFPNDATDGLIAWWMCIGYSIIISYLTHYLIITFIVPLFVKKNTKIPRTNIAEC